MSLQPGSPAPDFAAPNQDGKQIRLSALRGKPVLLTFYPKDDTPGCTKEACNLRDDHQDFIDAGAVVFGISRQDGQSHRAFRDKHRIPYDLLVDPDGSIAKLFGFGKIPILGLHKRRSVLVAADGTIAKLYEKVDPAGHSKEVLQDLAQLKTK